MELSEIEMHFLHEFEESDEYLFLLEVDVKLHFAEDKNDAAGIRETVINTIKALYSKKLIELFECRYEETKPDHFEILSTTKMPESSVDEVLGDPGNWDKDYLCEQTVCFFFHPTEEGLKRLDEWQS